MLLTQPLSDSFLELCFLFSFFFLLFCFLLLSLAYLCSARTKPPHALCNLRQALTVSWAGSAHTNTHTHLCPLAHSCMDLKSHATVFVPHWGENMASFAAFIFKVSLLSWWCTYPRNFKYFCVTTFIPHIPHQLVFLLSNFILLLASCLTSVPQRVWDEWRGLYLSPGFALKKPCTKIQPCLILMWVSLLVSRMQSTWGFVAARTVRCIWWYSKLMRLCQQVAVTWVEVNL